MSTRASRRFGHVYHTLPDGVPDVDVSREYLLGALLVMAYL